MAKWIYSHDGMGCLHDQPDDTAIAEGAVAFDHPASPEELAAAFPNYAAAIAAATAAASEPSIAAQVDELRDQLDALALIVNG